MGCLLVAVVDRKFEDVKSYYEDTYIGDVKCISKIGVCTLFEAGEEVGNIVKIDDETTFLSLKTSSKYAADELLQIIRDLDKNARFTFGCDEDD